VGHIVSYDPAWEGIGVLMGKWDLKEGDEIPQERIYWATMDACKIVETGLSRAIKKAKI
jgi:hypothetical protein